jgi:hypothetical protein
MCPFCVVNSSCVTRFQVVSCGYVPTSLTSSCCWRIFWELGCALPLGAWLVNKNRIKWAHMYIRNAAHTCNTSNYCAYQQYATQRS